MGGVETVCVCVWGKAKLTHVEGKKGPHLGYLPIISVWETDHKFVPALGYLIPYPKTDHKKQRPGMGARS